MIKIEDKPDDKLSIQENFFDELLNKRMGEIQKKSDEINFNDLTYYFPSPNIAPIKFIGFRGPLNIYNEMKNGNISIKNVEEYQKNLKNKF